MPFKSQAQRAFMRAKHPELVAEFEKKTLKGKPLPEHVKGSKSPVAKAKGTKAKDAAKKRVKEANTQESLNHDLKPRPVERDVLEFMLQDKPCKVDRDKGIIYQVHLCGPISKNGGKWPRTTLESALDMLEGVKCNIDHPDRDKPGTDRRVRDRFGIYHNPVIGNDGAYADLHYLKTHEMAETVCEAAERMPEALGFSINARTIQTPDADGSVIHESITRVRSVDLVADPATTSSIFESENMNDPHTQGKDQREQDEQDDSGGGEDQKGGNMGAGPADIEQDPIDVSVDALLGKYLPAIKGESDQAKRKGLLGDLKNKINAVIEALIDEPDVSGVSDEDEDSEDEDSEDEEGSDEGQDEEESEKPVGSGTAGDSSEKKVQESVDDKKIEQKKPKPSIQDDYEQVLDVLESAKASVTRTRIKALLAVPVADRVALASTWTEETVETPAQSGYEQALDVLESAGVQPTKVRIKTLLAVPVEDRAELVASWPKGNSASTRTKPKSSSVLESSRQDKANNTGVTTPEQLKDDAMLLFSAS